MCSTKEIWRKGVGIRALFGWILPKKSSLSYSSCCAVLTCVESRIDAANRTKSNSTMDWTFFKVLLVLLILISFWQPYTGLPYTYLRWASCMPSYIVFWFLCMVHVISTGRQLTNLVPNVCFDFFSRQIRKYYKSLKMISFELKHTYNTLNVPQIVKLGHI